MANTNDEVLEYLAQFYQLPLPEREDPDQEATEDCEAAQGAGGQAEKGDEQAAVAAAAAELAAESELDAQAKAQKARGECSRSGSAESVCATASSRRAHVVV